MADNGGESTVRNVLDNGSFIYDGKHYEIIENAKPSGETKTDFFLIARNTENDEQRTFKISYKKPSYSFVENKVKPHRIVEIFGNNWKRLLVEQITRDYTIKERLEWKKSSPKESLIESFNNMPLIDFVKKKIMLGWRYEIESLDANCGNRTLSTRIIQDISAKVFWDKGCSESRKNAMIHGRIISNSGIPSHILIKDPSDIKTPQDVFNELQDIRQYAKKHNRTRASFLSQYYRLDSKGMWSTEGLSRTFAVWVKWKIINGKLGGKIVFDKPLEKSANDILGELSNCLAHLDIDIHDDFESLLGKTVNTIVIR